MAEGKTTETENKAPAKPDGDSINLKTPSIEASQNLFSEVTPSAAKPSENTTTNAFDKSRAASATMSESGLLPPLQIEDEKNKNTTDKNKANDTPEMDDDELKDMQQGMRDAKAKTKGWDSSTAPPIEQLKETIGDSKVLFWGDDHLDKESPERFKGAMDSLKKAGVDTVAMECFREDQQKLVNDWLASKQGTADEKSLETTMRAYLDKTLNSGPEFTDKVMDFMKGAKDGGMKVLCIEPNGGKITYDGDGEDKERDGNWNKVTQNYIKENPESKVLILAGSGHFIHMRDQSVADKLAQDGIKTTDITPPSQFIDGEILLAR